jgi:eukaryotic-like serine/threonine-protein kinase
MTLASGKKLGPYEILSSAGTGGMGEVYRARDSRLDRIVAIKVIAGDVAHNSDLRQRFEREARAISSLSHPHICALHDIGESDGTEYMVMEFLEGECLADRLAKGPLPTEQVLRYGMEIADALDAAHKHGVVHRDLKPANIILTKGGAKLLDFGLAKPTVAPISDVTAAAALTAMATSHKPVTAEGHVVGTFQYMAPEQLEGKEADARSDIFALGTVLYEMASGRRAFPGKTQASIIAGILAADPPPISSIQPLTPPALTQLIKTCMAKDPDERWQTAHDIKIQLKHISEGSSQAGIPAPVKARRQRREMLAWGLAAIALIAACLAGAAYWRGQPDRVSVKALINPPPGAHFEAIGDVAGPLVVSPDGKKIAFVASIEGRNDLWVRPLDSLNAIEIAGTENATFPFWSPDSRMIAYFADGKLKKVDATHGPGLTITDAPVGRGGWWGPGDIILYSADFRSPLMKVSASGGTPVQVTKLIDGQETTHRWPQILPGGKHFLYMSANHLNPKAGSNGIYWGSFDGKPPVLVMSSGSNALYASGQLLFLRENTLMAQKFDPDSGMLSGEPVNVTEAVFRDDGTWRSLFSVSNNGVLAYQSGTNLSRSQLTWVDAKGSSLAATPSELTFTSFALSPNGKQVIVVGDPNNELWNVDLARGTRARLTFDGLQHAFPAWSPDGKRVAYLVTDVIGDAIAARSASGVGQEETLLPNDEKTGVTRYFSDWSHDGRFLVYSEGIVTGNSFAIWALPISGNDRSDRKPFIVVPGNATNIDAHLSSDGKWLAYSSNETGRYEVYVTTFPKPNGKWQISTNGGRPGRWSPDGKRIFYLSAGGDIMSAEVETKAGEFSTGKVERLFHANGISQIFPDFDVSPDGKRFLLPGVMTSEQPPITLVTDWTAALKK